MTIIVCPLSHVPEVIAARRPSHLVTLLGPASMIETPQGIEPERHLRLGLHDITDPAEDMILPTASHMGELLAFGAGWTGEAPVLVHCWAGISRSTASAFILACARNPKADEAMIAKALRRASPTAAPNRRLVALADDLLRRDGRMSRAVEAIGAGDTTQEGRPFDLALGDVA
jgi:predicted protein tyrosine phosphatase